MIEFPGINSGVPPVRIESHPADIHQRALRQVVHEASQRFPLKHELLASYRSGKQTGDDSVRVTQISDALKISYDYFWCVGAAGFGNQRGTELSFLSHGQAHIEKQVLYVGDAVKRLLDTCGPDSCDFVIFAGDNNIPGANGIDGTFHRSLEVQTALADMIARETHGLIMPVIIRPDSLDNLTTDLIGKSAVVETPSRTLHVFERLRLKDLDESKYRTPEQRAKRYKYQRSPTLS